jgi:hypothetical protein
MSNMPNFYYELPIGVLTTIHNMSVWLNYSENREYEDMLTASMVCSLIDNYPEPELSLKKLLIK